MTEDDIRAELTHIRQRIDALQERRRLLHAMLDGPRVLAVAHSMRYSRQRDDAYESVEQAIGVLAAQLDNGDCSPIGVSVGGYRLTDDEAAEYYPGELPW